jgi:hypothetical protein
VKSSEDSHLAQTAAKEKQKIRYHRALAAVSIMCKSLQEQKVLVESIAKLREQRRILELDDEE